jgi:hypothetical protein
MSAHYVTASWSALHTAAKAAGGVEKMTVAAVRISLGKPKGSLVN